MPESLQQIVRSLQAEVHSLRREVASLREAVEVAPLLATEPVIEPVAESIEPVAEPAMSGLTAESPSIPPVFRRPRGLVAPGQPDPSVARRTLLSAGAAALAGTVAGTSAAVLGSPSPAAAANGDAVTCGQTKTASSSTELRYNGAGMVDWNLLTVQDTTNTQTNYPSAICGMASSDVSFGVQGYSSVADAAGVLAYGGAQSYGLYARGGRANISLRLAGAEPRDRADFHQAGELLATSAGGLWYCVAGGSPGAWRCVASSETVGALELLDPAVRVYDSRPNYDPLGVVKGVLNGAERTVDCLFGGDGVRDGAGAVLVNVTVVNTSAAGWMSLFEAGIAWPGTSTLNWYQAGSVVANIAVVPCSIQALITAKVPANSSTHFLVDLIGFYR